MMQLPVLTLSLVLFTTPFAHGLPMGTDYEGLFDGNGAVEPLSGFLALHAPSIPGPGPARPVHPDRKYAYQILAEQEGALEKKFYTPQEIMAMIREDYGDNPTSGDEARLKEALIILEGTALGSRMCRSIAYGCSLESMKKAGIVLRVKDMPGGARGNVPMPVEYAGRTFLGINKSAVSSQASTEYLAMTLAHEMSHIEDLRKNKRGSLVKAEYASDEKALTVEFAVYDEISRKHPGFSHDFYDLLVQFWAWKIEAGAYPKHHFYVLPLGKNGEDIVITTKDLINNYGSSPK